MNTGISVLFFTAIVFLSGCSVAHQEQPLAAIAVVPGTPTSTEHNLVAASNPATVTTTDPNKPTKMSPKTFLALGDSYTIGQGVSEEDRWPVQLVSKLKAAGMLVADPVIIAKTGWTTTDLENALRAARPKPTFDIVTLLIGVNDQFQGQGIDEYTENFSALLDQSIVLAKNDPKHVIVVSIPDWGTTPFAAGYDRAAIRREIDQFNAINKSITEKKGAHYADVTSISRNNADETTPDGLHPSKDQYATWVAALLPTATSIAR